MWAQRCSAVPSHIRLAASPVLSLMFVVAVLCRPGVTLAQWETVRERQGEPPQGYVQTGRMPGKNFVVDCHGKTLGWTTPEGTYNDQGRQIATLPMPGRLLDKSDCPRK